MLSFPFILLYLPAPDFPGGLFIMFFYSQIQLSYRIFRGRDIKDVQKAGKKGSTDRHLHQILISLPVFS
jgi:hypothetical protein